MNEHHASSQSQAGDQIQKELEENFGRPMYDVLYDLYVAGRILLIILWMSYFLCPHLIGLLEARENCCSTEERAKFHQLNLIEVMRRSRTTRHETLRNAALFSFSVAVSEEIYTTVFSSPLASDAAAPLREAMTRFVFAGRKIDELACFLTSPFFSVKDY